MEYNAKKKKKKKNKIFDLEIQFLRQALYTHLYHIEGVEFTYNSRGQTFLFTLYNLAESRQRFEKKREQACYLFDWSDVERRVASPRNRAARSQFIARIRGRQLWVYQPVYYLITIKIYTPSFATVNCIIECILSGSSRSYASLSSPASRHHPFLFSPPLSPLLSLSLSLTFASLLSKRYRDGTKERSSSRLWWLSWISRACGNQP